MKSVFYSKVWEAIVKDHLIGLSPLGIARKYGFKYNTVRAALKRKKIFIPRGNRAYENPGIKENIFDKINTSAKAYWLGMMAADGNVCITKNYQYIVQLYLEAKDFEHVMAFNKFLGNKKDIRFHFHKSGYGQNGQRRAICAVSSKKLVDGLIKHGIVPRKTNVLVLPKLKSQLLFWNYLRGYWDGDGTIGKDYVSLVGNNKFLSEVANFIEKEFKFDKVPKLKVDYRHPNIFQLRYCTTKAAIIAWKMYGVQGPRLRRKYKKAIELIKRYPLSKSRHPQTL